ncbi:MAG: VCBS repeat-containing protein, partial [Bacteroidetes bacterium]
MKRTFFMLVWLLGLSLAEAQPGFTDVSQKAGFLPLPGAEGIAVGDFNNDGYEDVYVSNTQSTNLLYQNQGDGTFVEVAGLLGLALEPDTDSRTALWGDINNDGWLDLYVGNKAAPDRLFLNLRGEAFEDISSQAGIFQDGHPKSVNMADVNADGFLDIYVSNFASENALLLNQGDTSFVNAIYWSGALDKGLAMGTVIFDYDKDGDPDLYLVHDGREPNLLYENDGTGRFMEVAARAGVNTQSFGMGVDIGDINNDGWMDIYIANLGPNILLLNNGDGTFANISQLAGVEDAGMGWGTNLLDYDNDGLLDMYVANDFDFSPHPYYNVLYRNAG